VSSERRIFPAPVSRDEGRAFWSPLTFASKSALRRLMWAYVAVQEACKTVRAHAASGTGCGAPDDRPAPRTHDRVTPPALPCFPARRHIRYFGDAPSLTDGSRPRFPLVGYLSVWATITDEGARVCT